MDAPRELPFWNPDLPIEERVRDLAGRMTREEKIAQLLHDAPAIERLGVPAYNWWNECLHGVGRAGGATVFPQAIGLAATFDPGFLRTVADTISDEARAKHHEAARRGDLGIYKGLTYWTPNINLFRDPRWGRGQETYGECPWLSGRLACAFVSGLQGDDPVYLKLVATPKHFAVHSGPEEQRHSFDAVVSEKDLRESYLPHFRDVVVEGKAWSVMGAYNRTNGEPCCGSRRLLVEILRREWGFSGYVVSDCWAVQDFHEHHKVTKTRAESAALAVRMGCDLNCGCTYQALGEALDLGLLDEADIDICLYRLLEARFRLGMFDPPERVPFAAIPFDVVGSAAHRRLAREAARRSIVLLRNRGVLPLDEAVRSVAVIGPLADDRRVLLGNYHGTPAGPVTLYEGVRGAAGRAGITVTHAVGCELLEADNPALGRRGRFLAEAEARAADADVAIVALGLTADLEGEQGDASNADAAGDRLHLDLPGLQQALLERVVATGTPTVVVLFSGSALSVTWADEHAAALLHAWYPGEEGGNAIADILFGDAEPEGRLPVTFYRSVRDLPPFEDYAMENRTYRFFRGEALYPFGYGLGYTTVEYRSVVTEGEEMRAGEETGVRVEVANTGARPVREKVQLYVRLLDGGPGTPLRDLRGLETVALAPGETREVRFVLGPRDVSRVTDSGERVVETGRVEIATGTPGTDSWITTQFTIVHDDPSGPLTLAP